MVVQAKRRVKSYTKPENAKQNLHHYHQWNSQRLSQARKGKKKKPISFPW
jgi:hypothetical protein